MMNRLWRDVRWTLYPGARFFLDDVRFCTTPWVLGRVACMGLDVYRLLNPATRLINVQKGRVDYLVDVALEAGSRARASQVAPFMRRQDIIPLVVQQQRRRWLRSRPPRALLMDSFSELTDQLFEHRREGWRFCCNYADLSHGPELERTFEAKGLLPPDELYDRYRRFFEFIRQRWGEIPIVFLHFPVTLEKREKFKNRYQNIAEAISRVGNEFSHFHSIAVDEAIVDWPEKRHPDLEDFPYHFNNRTYEVLAGQVRAIGIFG